jgi:hypothetical protein
MSQTQSLLNQVALSPERYIFGLKGRRIYLLTDKSESTMIGYLNYDIPAVAIPMLKIKSWRVQRNENADLSLILKLSI